jgi:23S rRNA (pseudouridine1915-N3)-methyltransferase
MIIDLIVTGKTVSEQVDDLVGMYQKRINRYAKFNILTLPDIRSSGKLPVERQKRMEGEALLRVVGAGDCVALLDEKGAGLSSVEFAAWLQKQMNGGRKRLCFVIGGPYGFSTEAQARADEALSLSPMTFSHQIVRAIFCEQLYRAFTILAGEPYHHG